MHTCLCVMQGAKQNGNPAALLDRFLGEEEANKHKVRVGRLCVPSVFSEGSSISMYEQAFSRAKVSRYGLNYRMRRCVWEGGHSYVASPNFSAL